MLIINKSISFEREKPGKSSIRYKVKEWSVSSVPISPQFSLFEQIVINKLYEVV